MADEQEAPRGGGDDMADAAAGGSGAPPEPDRKNRAPQGLTREYRGEGIQVQWYAQRCIHSAACIRALPQVFDPDRRPWVELDAAGADAIAEAVLRCPTGALHYTRTDGGAPEPVPNEISVRAVRDGPLYVHGQVELRDSQGELIRSDTRMAICRCGQSEHMPFCDNTHRAIRFRSAPAVGEAES